MKSESWSLRSRLVLWLILPVVALMMFDTLGLYHRALTALNSAYDRSLLGSARMIGDLLEIRDDKVVSLVPSTVLEFYEGDNRSRLLYRIKGFRGEHVTGYPDFPEDLIGIPPKAAHPNPVSFFDAEYNGEPVRVATLYQPVASRTERGLAQVQVAELLSIRREKAKQLLVETIAWQMSYLAATICVTWLVVTAFLRPLRRLEQALLGRSPDQLGPVDLPGVRELNPVVTALNEVMGRLQETLGHQRRFIRDASHQLKSPLAAMKIQLQLAQRDTPLDPGFIDEVAQTTDRAITVTNQLLALAKIEQVRGQAQISPIDLAAAARQAVITLSPLISERHLQFELTGDQPIVVAHAWMIDQLMLNLLSNAIKHAPEGKALGIDISETELVVVRVWNQGEGISPTVADRLFQPFSTTDNRHGTGLGLTICHEIVEWIRGTIALRDFSDGDVRGVEAVIRLPRSGVAHSATPA